MLTAARVSSVIAVSTALICSVALPATAAEDSTQLTVALTGDRTLAISAPEEASFGDVAPGVAVTTTAVVPNVTVTDTRGGLANFWTASVALGAFTGINNSANTFTGVVFYEPGNVTANAGTLIGGVPNTLAVAPVPAFYAGKDATPAVLATGILGNNSAKWSPTLTLAVPDNAPADTYKATLTHSVL